MESNWWKTGEIEKYRFKTTSVFRYDDVNLLKLILLAGDDDLRADGYDLYTAFAGYRHLFGERHSVFFAARCKSTHNDKSEKILYSVESRYGTESRGNAAEFLFRWYDPDSRRDRDHYVYCSVRESFEFGECFRISVLMSTRFGPEQDAAEKAKIQIETTVWL